MLNVTFDPSRRVDDGQYFVELSDHPKGDLQRVNRLGYWCDKGHLKHMARQLVQPFAGEILGTLIDMS